MENKYVNAVNKLEFSDNLLKKVPKTAPSRVSGRKIRALALAAMLVLMMATTAFGVASAMRERPGSLVEVGTDKETMMDAEIMKFKVSEDMEGVKVHYMELEPNQHYSLRHGLLSTNGTYQRVTEEYTLEPVELRRVEAALEKNDRVYKLTFDYMETEKGIVSNHRSVYQKDANGEILLCANAGRSGQWPVYLNVETGEIRDALPGWTAEDFEGRISDACVLRRGILITTVVEDSTMMQGQRDNSYSLMYWIAPVAEHTRMIEIPKHALDHVENDTIYYQDKAGCLFVMDEEFEFHQISEYPTTDDMRDGILIVSVRGRLGILDAFTGETYVFDELAVQKWDVDDYDALRYGNNGTVALVKTEWLHDPERRVLTRLGVLDYVTGELKLLSIENDYDGYQHTWLDENRFAVVYQSEVRQFLCVYEFEK